MGIADDQMHPGQAAGAQRGQKLAPELVGLTVTHRGAQHFTRAVGTATSAGSVWAKTVLTAAVTAGACLADTAKHATLNA